MTNLIEPQFDADRRQPKCHPARPQGRYGRRGFSFTEILFAVMILGIGFIMVAAMFPVAIKQTEESVQETVASSVAKEGASFLGRLTQGIPVIAGTNTPDTANYPYGNFPPTFNIQAAPLTSQAVGVVYGADVPPQNPPTAASYYPSKFYSLSAGNMILSVDSRYAWVPFYLRSDVIPPVSNQATVILIAVQSRNTAGFSAADLIPQNAGAAYNGLPTQPVANLQGRAMLATFTQGVNTSTLTVPDTITFAPDGSNPNPSAFSSPYGSAIACDPDHGAVAEGAYVIVADDNLCSGRIGSKTANPYTCNGYIYKLGTLVTGSTYSWNLAAGSDTKGGRYAPLGVQARVFVVGRGFNSPGGLDPAGKIIPGTSDTTFSGPAMDVAAFCTFIKLQ